MVEDSFLFGGNFANFQGRTVNLGRVHTGLDWTGGLGSVSFLIDFLVFFVVAVD